MIFFRPSRHLVEFYPSRRPCDVLFNLLLPVLTRFVVPMVRTQACRNVSDAVNTGSLLGVVIFPRSADYGLMSPLEALQLNLAKTYVVVVLGSVWRGIEVWLNCVEDTGKWRATSGRR